jgi:hypothetical protein
MTDDYMASVMSFVGYQYQKEREKERMSEWEEVEDVGDAE